MSSIIGAALGSFITARVYKYLQTNPALRWANTYEFIVNSPPTEADLQACADALRLFEAAIHYSDTRFDRCVLSTWVPDGEPYDPTSFVTLPLVGSGSQTDTSDTLSLNHVLFVRRTTNFGQNGKLYYRRCLAESEVNATAGTLALVDPSALQTLIDGAMTTSGLALYIQNEVTPLNLVMKSALPIVREVLDFTVAGARIVQFNNRYFDVP